MRTLGGPLARVALGLLFIAGWWLCASMPVPAAGMEWQTYLNEEFEGEESMFYTGQAGEAFYDIDDTGRYVINGLDTDSDSLSALTDSLYYYYVEATCELVSSDAENLAFVGIVFHYQKLEDGSLAYYVFYMYGDGYYGAKRVMGDKVDIALPLTKSDMLDPGMANVLGVEAQGSRFDLFINGKHVDGFTDLKLDGGGFGFYISKRSEGAFDDFVVKVEKRDTGQEPPEEPNSAEDGAPTKFTKYQAPYIPKDPNRPLYPWEVGVDKSKKGKKAPAEPDEDMPVVDDEDDSGDVADGDDTGSGREAGKAKPADETKKSPGKQGKPKQSKKQPPPSKEDEQDKSGAGGSTATGDDSQAPPEETEKTPPDEKAPVTPDEAAPVPPEEEASPSDQDGGTAESGAAGSVSDSGRKDEGSAAGSAVQDEAEAAPQDDAAPSPDDKVPYTAKPEEPPHAAAPVVADSGATQAEATQRDGKADAEGKSVSNAGQDRRQEMAAMRAKQDDWLDSGASPVVEFVNPPEKEHGQPVGEKNGTAVESGELDLPDAPGVDSSAAAQQKTPVGELALLPGDEPEASPAVPAARNKREDGKAASEAEDGKAPAVPNEEPVQPEPGAGQSATTVDADSSEPASNDAGKGDGADTSAPGTIIPSQPTTLAELKPEELPGVPLVEPAQPPAGNQLPLQPQGQPEQPARDPNLVQIDDDFSEQLWAVAESETATYRYFGAAYEINNLNAATMALSFQNEQLNAMEVSCDIEFLDGVSYVGYGLAGRFSVKNGQPSYYGLFICQSGEFMLLSVIEGKETVLQDWTASPQFKPNQPNRIKLELAGSTLRAYINNELVTTVKDETITSGGYALLAGPGIAARFDNFSLRGVR